MKRLCTICARGGSKGLPSKNLRLLHGRPLIAHSVQHAIDAGIFEGVAVSSDSREILDAGLAAGATWAIERPAPLASDTADKSPAIVHCAREVERTTGASFELFVDLDATAPLRLPEHVREAAAMIERGEASNVFSVCPSRRSPYFNMCEVGPDGAPRLCKTIDPPPVRRQDAPRTYDLNASIYAWDRRSLFELGAPVFAPGARVYVMPSNTVFDIDDELDFQLIEFLYPRLRGAS